MEDRKSYYMSVKVLFGHLPFLVPMQIAHLERYRTRWLIIDTRINTVLIEDIFNHLSWYVYHYLVIDAQF